MADEQSYDEVEITELTEAQVAMLALLGNPPECGQRRPIRYIEVDPPGGGRPIVRRHLCPLVLLLGTPRMILPNGDVSSQDHAANDRPNVLN